MQDSIRWFFEMAMLTSLYDNDGAYQRSFLNSIRDVTGLADEERHRFDQGGRHLPACGGYCKFSWNADARSSSIN